MKKILILAVALIVTFTPSIEVKAFSISEGRSMLNNLDNNAGGRLLQCSRRSVNRMLNGTIGRVNNYTESMRKNVRKVMDTDDEINKSIRDAKRSRERLERSYVQLKEGTIKSINDAYGSVNEVIVDNMDAVLGMTEAMKNEEDFEGYVYENGEKVLKTFRLNGIANAAERIAGRIPTSSDVRQMEYDLEQINNDTEEIDRRVREDKDKSLKNIKRFEKGVSLLTGDDFRINDYTRDLANLEELKMLMNLPRTQLPEGLSTAMNVAEYAPQLVAFMQSGFQQMEYIKSITNQIRTIRNIQKTQERLFKTLEALRGLEEGFTAISAAIELMSWDFSGGFSWDTAKTNFRNNKGPLKDLYKAAKDQFARGVVITRNVNKMVNTVERAEETFNQDIRRVQGLFTQSHDIVEFITALGQIPALRELSEEALSYLDGISGEARRYRRDLSGFGRNARTTERVLGELEPYVQPVKEKVSEIGDSIKESFKSDDEVQENLEEDEAKTAETQSAFEKIKEDSSRFSDAKDKAKRNIRYLKEKYRESDRNYQGALRSLNNLERQLDQLPDRGQLRSLAERGLGITKASRDIMSAYRKVNSLNPDELMKPVNKFQRNMEKLAEVKRYTRDFERLANQAANAQRMVDGVQGTIQSIGGLMRCFDIDPKQLLYYVLSEAKDDLEDDAKRTIWDGMGEMSADLPYFILPKTGTPEFKNPFRPLNESFNQQQLWENTPKNNNHLREDLQKLAGVKPQQNYAVNQYAGLQYAAIHGVGIGDGVTDDEDDLPVRTTPQGGGNSIGAQADSIRDLQYDHTIDVNMEDYESRLDYKDTMSAWEFKLRGIKTDLFSLTTDFKDFKAKSYLFPFTCGHPLKKSSYCWYWRWVQIGPFMIPVAFPLPACDTQLKYKEPTVHLEVSPRSGTSHIGHLEILRDIPDTIDEWNISGEMNTVPQARVFGISPIGRAISKLNPLFANHTMACDLAEKWDEWPYIKYEGVLPLPSYKLGILAVGSSIIDLKDWNKEWFNGKAVKAGQWPAPISILYASELNRSRWNPRVFPNGETPTGESYPDFGEIRDEAYQYALPYTEGEGESLVGNVKPNKCDAGAEGNGKNVCIGKWGALFPRNGQVAVDDPRYPLKRYSLLAWRAYDRVLEQGYVTHDEEETEETEDTTANAASPSEGSTSDTAEEGDIFSDLGSVFESEYGDKMIQGRKIASGTSNYGVGYDKTEFSIEWPYRSKRYKVGTDPKEWEKGFYGDKLKSGGMVMTLWRETKCCVRVCCQFMSLNAGETYPWGGPEALKAMIPIATDAWKITDVTKQNFGHSGAERMPGDERTGDEGWLPDFDDFELTNPFESFEDEEEGGETGTEETETTPEQTNGQ